VGSADEQRKIRVAVVYGGRSSEHEVALESAKHVLGNLDPERFEVLPIAIDKQGVWHAQSAPRLAASQHKALPIEQGDAVELLPRPTRSLHRTQAGTDAAGAPIDVVFPVMHGPLCEDGSIQGLFELADVAYVGAGVLGSAICMDKDVAKRLVREAGIATVEYFAVRPHELARDPQMLTGKAEQLGYPLFVKPASLGSSVGIARVESPSELLRALRDALRFDTKALVERAVDAREIELAVLGSLELGAPPDVSQAGEIVPKGGFYSYERKYLDPDGAELVVPAALEPAQAEQARGIAGQVFSLLECDGMARVDLFLDRQSGQLLFNEVNTIPGFTTISMYPKLWEASGLSYRDLLTRLVLLALQRHRARAVLERSR
jgi:D-alanine-D-alanine ligase